jgi:competence ComEA-like helix-hairpin-helix protein
MPESDESEDMPEWLSELDSTEDEDSSLENALRHSESQLSTEEKDFLDQSEKTQEENADWLAKLDLVDDQQPSDSDSPAIRVDVPEGKAEQPEGEPAEEVSFTGGILDRLKDTGAIKIEPEIPQWLENLKKEEDPQETAILWLKQFVEQGDQADLTDQIKRYTDELNPGDTVPTWMEDLKNEEDPQTTAMLWLEKLSGERPAPEKPKPKQIKPDDSDWFTALEKEEAEQSQVKTGQPAEDFQDDSNGWLADLDIDEKIKTEQEELPDWMEDPDAKPSDTEKGDTPLWMKATSPLEGDFHTDELAGDEKEVEIPDWLAGYGEGEAPEEQTEGAGSAAAGEPDEYTWVPASDEPPKPAKEPIDLNSAAISQLEGILGISYQVARGIIRYREQHGPYQDINDLLKVPEITDEQTIDILKPEVVIHETKIKPTPVIAKKPQINQDPGERLAKARSLMAERNFSDSLAEYGYLIKKKKSLTEVIDDLSKAVNDFPSDVSIIKTLGDAYMKINNLEAALESYSKAEDLLR